MRAPSLAVSALALVVLADIAPAARPAAAPAIPDAKLFKKLAFRSIGPANMGGRITDLAVDEAHPATFFLGTATGGAFKTTNGGTTWKAVFDQQAVASVGAMAISPASPRIVWLGTGEANSRNSSSWGRGVYRSSDGGSAWSPCGLEATASIARVVADAADSNVAYVAALGRLWGENPERGVYVTRDGGRTWEHTLKVDARTGASDLAQDPADPRVLYAAMWSRLRTPWSFRGNSGTGGIWKSTDAGRTWRKLGGGLPSRTGRIGLAVYHRNPRIVYAVVESDLGGRVGRFDDGSRDGGVFRSEDAGESWTRLSPIAPRPFYFSQIRVQPDDSSRVYLLGVDVYVSDDGGRSFRARGARNLHPDAHAMWISRTDGSHLMLGTDGGLFVSRDRAANWDFVNNLALGQVYNLGADMREPYYRVYAGMQDNQTWGGPSRTRFEHESWLDDPSAKGILNDHWYVLGGGDGFHVAADPDEPSIVYYESQGGHLVRQDLVTGRERALRPASGEGEPEFRFNWNTPFQVSPHDPRQLWMGAQYLFRLDARGDRWTQVSPDLTTRDPERMASAGSGAERYCTITTLAESPITRGLVWVGTDDGRLWRTPDGGVTWTDLTANLRGVPRGTYVSRIEASHHDDGTAYVCLDGHRTDDLRPWLFVTRDGGRSWRPLTAGLPADAPVKVVREGRRNPNLLFAGTEFGLWASLDGGGHWMAFGQGLPTVAIDDLLIHPREGDLIAGTHGRSIWILDGIHSLEQWNARALQDTLTLFEPRPAWTWWKRPLGAVWGQRPFFADNPPFGATLDYFLAREIGGGVKLTIRDSTGREIRRLEGTGSVGLNRVAWDLTPGDPRERIALEEDAGQPSRVPAGRYAVIAEAGGVRRETSLVVRAVGRGDPEP